MGSNVHQIRDMFYFIENKNSYFKYLKKINEISNDKGDKIPAKN